MIHYMRLNDDQFDRMSSGFKRVELRLNDDKRKKLRPGHRILFKATSSSRELCVEVTRLRVYKGFKELYQDYGAEELGYKEDQVKDYRDMLEIYSQKDQDDYGALAIEIRLLF